MRKRLDFPEDVVAYVETLAAQEHRDVVSQFTHMLLCYVPEMAIRHDYSIKLGFAKPTFETTEKIEVSNWASESPKPSPSSIEVGADKPKVDAQDETTFSIEHALACDSIENSDEKLKAQAQAVLEAWKALFPTARKLAYTRAVSWIQQRWDSAAEVVEVFLSVKERVDAGRAQVMPAFDNYVNAAIPPKEPRKPKPSPQQTVDSATGWVMRPQTPEEEAEDARTQEIAIRNGWWKPEDLEGLV